MTDVARDKFLARRAELQRAGESYQDALAYGKGDWVGDRNLVLYYRPLTDEMEVWYELPNQKPELVLKEDVAVFDISKLCSALAYADNRNVSVEQKVADVDEHNAKVQAALDAATQDKKDAFKERLRHGIRLDTGNHVRPMTVSTKPESL